MKDEKILLEIKEERKRQREKGFSLDHDLGHSDGELEYFAVSVIFRDLDFDISYLLNPFTDSSYPFRVGPEWITDKKDHRKNLVKAAAVLMAAIERMDALDAQAKEAL